MAVAVVGLCFFCLVVVYGVYENWDMFLDYVVYGFLVGFYEGIVDHFVGGDK